MRKARLLRGAQLIETMIAVTLIGIALAVVAQVAISVSRLTNVVTLDSTMEDQSRHQLDQMIQDIKSTGLVRASYSSGGTAYTTDGSTTIVLQAPSYDSSGNILATSDTIIYYLAGAAAPYSLHRVVYASTGSTRSSEADKIIVTNIQSMTLTYLVSQTFTGDGSTTTFSLNGAPAGASPTEQVTVSGAAVSLGTKPTQVQFVSPSSLTFGTAPASAAPINALYSVDPSVNASQVTEVYVDLKLSITGTELGHSSTETQNAELSCQANLKNH